MVLNAPNGADPRGYSTITPTDVYCQSSCWYKFSFKIKQNDHSFTGAMQGLMRLSFHPDLQSWLIRHLLQEVDHLWLVVDRL